MTELKPALPIISIPIISPIYAPLVKKIGSTLREQKSDTFTFFDSFL